MHIDVEPYAYLVRMYLPPFNNMNKDMLKQILRGEKKVFLMENIRMVKVPAYQELKVLSLIHI